MDCSIQGCVKAVFATGLCHQHYEEQRRRHLPPCSARGCTEQSTRRGLCDIHYRAQLRKTAAPCSVEGCGRPTVARKLCDTHLKRVQRYGSLETDKRAHDRGAREAHPLYQRWNWQKRKGQLCDQWRDDFWSMVRAVGEQPSPQHWLRRIDERYPMGPGNWRWLETHSSADRNAYMRAWHKRNPGRSKNSELRQLYGIDLATYEMMLDAQGGVCAICRRQETARNSQSPLTSRRLAVDHCHGTKEVRGLLCTNCNTSIHMIERDPAIIERVVKYLGLKKD